MQFGEFSISYEDLHAFIIFEFNGVAARVRALQAL